MKHLHNILRLKSFTTDGTTAAVKFQDPESERIFLRPHPDMSGTTLGYSKTASYYFENAYEFINEDNEWYLDTATHTLYYKAPTSTNMSSTITTDSSYGVLLGTTTDTSYGLLSGGSSSSSPATEVVAPYLETLVKVEGTLDNPVKNLQFKGITFEHATWNKASEEGLVGGQACQYAVSTNLQNQIVVIRPPAGVYVACAQDILFENNTFKFMGSTGLDLHYGTDNCKVYSNTVEDISGNGINIGKFVPDGYTDYHQAYNPSDKREICTNDKIVNNLIRGIGTDYEGAVGIGGGYPRQIIIANNEITEAPYCGVSLGFGWTGADNAMKENAIMRNNIHHINLTTCDGGGIYTLSKQLNSLCTENYIHDIVKGSWFDYFTTAFYFDERTQGYIIKDNVTTGIGSGVTQFNYNGTSGLNTTGTNYPNADLNTNATAKKIADNAGIKQGLDCDAVSAEIRTILDGQYTTSLSTLKYDPINQTVTIIGSRLGEFNGKIDFLGALGSTPVSAQGTDIVKWTDSQIVCKVPTGAQSGIVNVYKADGTLCPGSLRFKLETRELKTVLEEKFENCQTGSGKLDSAKWNGDNSNVSVDNSTGSNTLLFTTAGSNVRAQTISSYGDMILTFDFNANTASTYKGFYIYLRTLDRTIAANQSTKNCLEYSILPGFNPILRLDEYINSSSKGGISSNLPAVMANKWYTSKIVMNNGMVYGKVWERGTAEPSGWTFTKTIDTARTMGQVSFEYYGTGEVGSIDNISIQEWSATDPNISSISYDIAKNQVVITGERFGDTKGSVLFTGNVGDIVVNAASSNIVSWTDAKIVCAVPVGAVKGVVYITKPDNTTSNMDKEITPETRTLQDIFNDKFDTSDTLSTTNWTTNSGASINITDSITTPNSLKLTSSGSNAKAQTKQTFGEGMITFDFNAKSASSYEGFYIYQGTNDRTGATVTKHGIEISLLPGYNPKIRIEEWTSGVSNGSAQTSKTISANTWYTCRVAISKGTIYLKVWPQGTTEPDTWDITKTISTSRANGYIAFEYYAIGPTAKSGLVDNVKIQQYSQYVQNVTSITVSSAANTISTKGGTLQLAVVVQPANAADKSVKWEVFEADGVTSTDKATISSTGVLTAVKDGSVKVKATTNDGSGVFGEKTITLSHQSDITVTGIIVSSAASTISTKGGTLQMSAAVSPDNATNKTVTWKVFEAGTNTLSYKAKIDSNGLLTAVKDGQVEVRAIAADGSKVTGKKIITLSRQGFIDIAGITVSSTASTINTKGGTLQMSAAVSPDNATDKSVTWKVFETDGVTATDKATIDDKGLLTAAKNGSIKVIAIANDGSGVINSKDILIENQPTQSGSNGSSNGGRTVTSTANTDAVQNDIKPSITIKSTSIIANIKTEGKVDSEGKVTATMSEKQIADAVDKVVSEAAKKAKTPQLQIIVDSPKAVNAAAFTISNEAMKKITVAQIEKFSVSTPVATVDFDSKALKAISDGTSSEMTLSVQKTNAAEFPQIEQQQISAVYDIKVTVGNKTIADLKDGWITVAVPYTLLPNQNKNNIVIKYIDKNGETVTTPSCKFDEKTQTVVFTAKTLSTYAVANQTVNFEDSANHWATSDINFAASRNLFGGTAREVFSPNGTMTRGMFVTVLGRLGEVNLDAAVSENQFQDVNSNAYYAKAVAWATENGIVSGVDKDKFAPNKPITREEMAVIFVNYAKVMNISLTKTETKQEFADQIAIASWSKDAVAQVQGEGLIGGKVGNTFAPKETATRAEVSATLKRFIENRLIR